eukprot:CAMPEP_0204534572 /NCGR_PEP_ID=MMETSP0661-20131031/13058_1 /ASSEMBLY_ACC=CAM_ASM_000606 /TAXON_ID=109239 /ORGANISM="Alexandrium margalefi, Strain AMGDE01CS-322" /LENGTH=426 /DNA_ID=CAMNT_0051541033 /DNA_START=207 /DNA_END=1485 /DNA_ORIENTATION=-
MVPTIFDGEVGLDVELCLSSNAGALDLLLRETEEHLLQGRLHQGVLLDGVRLAGLPEPLEDLAQAQAARAEPGQLVQVARVVRLEEPGLRGQGAPDEVRDLRRGPQVPPPVLRALLEAELHLVPGAVLRLQVDGGAEAPEAPEHLDADAVAHGLRLLHRVRRDDDGLGLGAHLDGPPEQPLGARVHGRRGLVQEEHAAGPDEGDGQRQLPLHAAAVRARGLARVLRVEAEALEEPVDGRVEPLAREPLQPAVEEEVLAAGEVPEEGVDLRAEAEVLEGLLRVRPGDRAPGHVHLAGGGRPYLAGQAPQGRRLPRAVRAQQAEALAGLDAQGDAAHSVHRARLAVAEDMPQAPVHAGLLLGGRVADASRLRLDVRVGALLGGQVVARPVPLLPGRGQQVGDQAEDDAQEGLPDPWRPEHPGAREVRE